MVRSVASDKSGKLYIQPIIQRDAKAWINKHHRHHNAAVGSIFQIALMKDEEMVGCIMVGRPVARNLDDGYTAEVNRTAVLEGIRNGCSKLLGAAARAARELGYKKIVTYTLPSESGASLRAVGWTNDHQVLGGAWTRPSRPRQVGMFPETEKLRWVKFL